MDAKMTWEPPDKSDFTDIRRAKGPTLGHFCPMDTPLVAHKGASYLGDTFALWMLPWLRIRVPHIRGPKMAGHNRSNPWAACF